jgi:hypothetical protein
MQEQRRFFSVVTSSDDDIFVFLTDKLTTIMFPYLVPQDLAHSENKVNHLFASLELYRGFGLC